MNKQGIFRRCLALLLALSAGLLPLQVLAQTQLAGAYLLDGGVLRSAGCVLYYLSADGEKLVPVVRQVSLLPEESVAEALVKALGEESEGLLSPFPAEAKVCLSSLEQYGNIVTINLSGDFSLLSNRELFNLKVAVVNTLTESGGIEYVNLLFNGVDLPTSDQLTGISLPTGTLTRFTQDLSSAWSDHLNASRTAATTGFTRNVTLYFLSADGTLLLPEVRSIGFTSDDFITPILEELARGPQDTQHLLRSLPSSLSPLDSPTYNFFSDGRRYADINLNYAFNSYLKQQPELRSQILGSVVCTLTTFIPNLEGVLIRVNRRYLEQDDSAYRQERVYIRAQFEALIGSALTLYLPKEDGRLKAVQRSVQRNAAGLRDLLDQLIAGPAAGEEDVLPVFPEGFDQRHVLGLCVVGDTLLFNLSQEGVALLAGLESQAETQLVYSIVNSYTSLTGIRRVQFLQEGNSLETFSGWIGLQEPLLRNPALVQQTLN